ncbi:TPA: hypothetical protein N5L18_003967 [Enterobacter cloacae subsp. dissolvens]|nr:hypothetical protein [Enterobacter cloacae subsp. dissolvens]
MTTITFDDVMIDTADDIFQSRDFSENWEGDILENTKGDTIFVPQFVRVHFKTKEEVMSFQPNSPITFKGAIWLAGASLLVAGGVLWAAYTQIQGQISDVRSEISTLRSSSHDDFNRVADKLDEINKTLTSIQIEQATQKAKANNENK